MTQTQDLADKVRTGDTEGIRNVVSDAAEQARKRAQEFGKQAKEKVDQGRSGTADAMDNTAEKIGKRRPRTGNTGRVAEIATGGLICFPRICFRESPALPGTHWERCTQTGLAPFPIVRDCQGTFQETMRVNLPLLPWTGT